MTDESTVNPWNEFRIWLFDHNNTSELDDSVIKAINPRSVLAMFCRHGDITIELNKVFNNYSVMNLDSKEFYKFLKNIVTVKNINPYSTTYFKSMKMDKTLKEKMALFPTLKSYEVIYLIDQIQKEDDSESILNALGIYLNKTKIKSKKLTKVEIEKYHNSNGLKIKTLKDLKKYIHD